MTTKRLATRVTKLVTDLSRPQWIAITTLVNLASGVGVAVLLRCLWNTGTVSSRIGYLVVIAVLLGVAAAATGGLSSVREAQFPIHPEVVLAMIRSVDHALVNENALFAKQPSEADLSTRRDTSLQAVKLYLSQFQSVLAEQWSTLRFGEISNVEVVLMKRASDDEVTVACWASRKPMSLQRRIDNPQFYENTEAAKLYREYIDRRLRAPIHLIPDISNYPNYDHLGRDDSLRTNSTALFPIYDIDTNFYGFVAVTARNRVGMFKTSDHEFWSATWKMWEPHLVRHISSYEKTGNVIEEAR
jgi:hypothetical protein